VPLLKSILTELIIIVHWEHLSGGNVTVLSHGQFERNGFDVEPDHSCQSIHSKVLYLVALVVTNVQDVTRLLLAISFLNAVGKPCFGVSSEFVGVLRLKNLAAQTLGGLHCWIVVCELLLQLFVFLLSIPIPLVYLLKFQARILGQLLELKLRWLTFVILVALLQLLDLIARLAVSLETDKSRSILGALLWFLFSNCLFGGR
jgi:hypothetical protein